MELKLRILEKMISAHMDKLGDMHYTALLYSFYDFQELSGLNKTDYETLLKDMRHEGLINIDVNGSNGFECARIMATKNGTKYLIANS